MIKKLWKYRWVFRSIFLTIYFNLKYLPLNQAIKLPILLYKPQLLSMKGSVKIIGKVRFGMIQMGRRVVSVYPNSGVVWENLGAHIIFKGQTLFGNDTYFSFGKDARIEFGESFWATAGLKFVSYTGVKIGKFVRFGWGNMLTDTNFHPLIEVETGKIHSPSAKIEIGDYCWFGTKCNIMPGCKIPDRCIFGIGSTITKRSEFCSYRVHKNQASEGVAPGQKSLYRDIGGEHDR